MSTVKKLASKSENKQKMFTWKHLLDHCAQLTRKNDLLLQEKREDKEKIRTLENLVEEKDGKIDKVVKDHVKVLLEENEKKDIRLRQQRAFEKEITGLKMELRESRKEVETLKEEIDVLNKFISQICHHIGYVIHKSRNLMSQGIPKKKRSKY